MTTITAAEKERRAGAIAHITCAVDEHGCGREPGQECVSTTGSGRTVTPHAIRKHDFDVWASRQPEVDELSATATRLTAEIGDLTRRVTEAAEDLATAQNNAASLTEQLRTARAGAALVPALQQQVAELTARIAELETPPVIPDEVLLQLDLSKVDLGTFTAVDAGLAFGQPGKIGTDTTWHNFTVGADPDGRRFLRWTSRRNTEGSANGISLAIPLARRVDEATYEADIRFSPGFGPSLGGKLPGLSMTTPSTSGTLAGGGTNPTTRGASNRHMWLGPGAGTWNGHKPLAPAEFTSYVYLDGVTEQERFWGVGPQPGVIMSMRSHDVLNTFDGATAEADGRLQAWCAVKGQPLAQVRDDAIRWRTDPTCQISHLFWSVFRGGPNDAPQWADNDDVPDYIDFFDGLAVTTPSS